MPSAARTTGGCAPGGDHPSLTEEVREAIHAVHGETLHRSRVSMRTRERMIHQYVRERFGDDAAGRTPGYGTLRPVWLEWFGTGGARQRYARSASLPTSGRHVVVQRPGQVVALDTTILPVKVRETVFGEPVSVHLTLALDVYAGSRTLRAAQRTARKRDQFEFGSTTKGAGDPDLCHTSRRT